MAYDKRKEYQVLLKFDSSAVPTELQHVSELFGYFANTIQTRLPEKEKRIQILEKLYETRNFAIQVLLKDQNGNNEKSE